MTEQEFLIANVGVNAVIQSKGSTGKTRHVRVDLDGINRMKPTFGGVIQNGYEISGKAYQGDLMQYSPNGKCYLLKLFKVAKAVTATDTVVYVERGDFSHCPDTLSPLMKAPATLSGAGASGDIVRVNEIEIQINSKAIPVYELTIVAGALGTLVAGDILVEAESAGAGKKMLVQNPNTVLDLDIIFPYPAKQSTTDYYKASYTVTPNLHDVLWMYKTIFPECVRKISISKVPEYFEI